MPLVRALFAAFLTIFFGHIALAASPPSTPSTTTAAPDPRAAQLKAQADASMDAHHYDEAIAGYSAAFAVSPDPAFLYNRSRAHEARGEYPEALADLDTFANTASPELRARVPRLIDLLVDLKLRVATLDLKCDVAGARVLLAGREIGVTPLPPTQVNAGSSVLEIVADGEFPYKKPISFKGGATTTVDVTMQAKASFGVLAVNSTPNGASISVDGKSFGPSPTEGVVAVGTHNVVAQLDGYADLQTKAVVLGGQRRDLGVTLEKKKTILSSPFFWGAVGVVVVAAAVTITAVLLTEKSPGTGDGFTPGQVAGPLTSW
jgi:hypothetical protein